MKLETYRNILLFFLILQYLFGSVGFVFRPDFFLPFTPFTILFTCFVYLLYQPHGETRFMQSMAAIASIGFLAEVIGVKTGVIFGTYYYGEALGLKLFKVPLVISCNWALIVSASIILVGKYFRHRALHAMLAALLATSIDFVIEQVVSPLDFWHFEGGIAGWHNYLGWFLLSFFLSLTTKKYLENGNSKIALYILILQVYFFSVILLLI